MGRFYDEQAIFQFLDFIKANFPVHFIRTNFIIGFHGETETDFQKLHSFISQDYFDNIALFEYHDEPLAPSFQLPEKVPDKVIRSRFRSLRLLVNQLLLARAQTRTTSSHLQ
jgi:tRNA A37 methylthiotransferase MiaB